MKLEGSVFFPFLKIGFSFATLQAFGKTPCEIARLQSAGMGFANMLAQSASAAPELSVFVIIIKTFLPEVLLKQKSSEIVQLEYI